jgi:hypothetical protein
MGTILNSTPLTNGTSVSFDGSASDNYYSFTLNSAGSVLISGSDANNNYINSVKIYDANFAQVDSFSVSGSTSKSLAAGNYYIQPVDNSGGSFSLSSTVMSDVTSAIPTNPSDVVITPKESDSNIINYFLLQISNALPMNASVHYETKDGTAIAGSDYIQTSGTATIKLGELSTVIEVVIIGDNIAESSEYFSLVLSSPTGALFPNGVTEIEASRVILDDDLNTASALAVNEVEIIGIETFSE